MEKFISHAVFKVMFLLAKMHVSLTLLHLFSYFALKGGVLTNPCFVGFSFLSHTSTQGWGRAMSCCAVLKDQTLGSNICQSNRAHLHIPSNRAHLPLAGVPAKENPPGPF